MIIYIGRLRLNSFRIHDEFRWNRWYADNETARRAVRIKFSILSANFATNHRAQFLTNNTRQREKRQRKITKTKKKNRKHRRKRQRRGSKDEKNSTSKRFRQPFARHYLHDRLPSPLSLAFLFFHFYSSPAPLSLVNTRPDERAIFNRCNEFPRANCPRIWQLELGHESYTQRMPDISLNFHGDAFKFQGNGSRCLSANPVVLIADISLVAARDKVPRGLGYCKIYRPIRFHLAEFCSKRMDGGSQVSGCEEFPRVDFAVIFTIFQHRCRESRISTVHRYRWADANPSNPSFDYPILELLT